MGNQKYSVTIDIGANISQVKNAVAEMQRIFNSMNLDAKGSSGITKLFGNLDKALSELQQKSNVALSGLTDSRQVERSAEKVNNILKTISQEFQSLGQSAPKDLAQLISGFSNKMTEATQKQNEYAKAIKETKSQAEKLAKAETSAAKKVAIAQETRNNIINKQTETKKAIEQYKNVISTREYTRNAKGGLQDYADQLEARIKELAGKSGARLTRTGFINEADTKKLATEDLQTYQQIAEALKSIRQDLDNFDKKTAETQKVLTSKESDLSKQADVLKQQNSILSESQTAWDKAKQAIIDFNQAGKESEAFDKLKQNLSEIFGDKTFDGVKNIQELEDALKQLSETAGGNVSNKLRQMLNVISSTKTPMKEAGEVIKKTNESFQELSERDQELQHLSSRLKYFFSIAGGFNLMRRAIRSAITTTKELDAVMTQTAVVSEYTVGDMWKTLPKYSKEAKRLGAAIKDVYSAQTLYVQQGLNMNDAMDLGVETLKMARVAGIGAEEATNSMTAALRGFNMELNESSAVRINDVYSKLAQNTASNVQEISTAMTKTAALANSANMSFENTAAFLATIIESTREGAETAGTALKTVIARFTEVKKLYDENELTGTDEEGQEIDVNKISKALRTAGINMNDFFTGAKGLDEIFMELGSKWDSLTTVQQRYIATMAAGSRQQSRFLALMQNYSRTVELTQMAYNSAGSGQEQFEKTLESLEAKINKFKDSWDTFIMGIANSDLIKGAIDFGTDFLDILNQIVDAISGSNGLIKSISSIGLAIGGFKIGRAIFGSGGVLGSILTGKGLQIGEKFGKTFAGGFVHSLTKEGRKETGGGKEFLKNWGYQKFVFKKTGIDYLEGITKENEQIIKNSYQKYQDDLTRIESGLTAKGTPLKISKEKATEQAEARFYKRNEKQGLTEEQSKQIIQNQGNLQVQKQIKDYNALGNTVLALGGAFVALGAAIDGIAGKSTKAGGVLKSLGSGAMIAGTALKGAAAAAELFGSALATALGVVGIAIGAITAIASIWDVFTESESEKQERHKKELEESGESLTSLKNKYKELEDSIDSLTEKEDAFKGLIKGTKEWDDAVKDLNTSIQTLVNNYPELIRAVKYNENGTLSLDEDIVKEVQKEYKNKVRDETYRNIAAKRISIQDAQERRLYSFNETNQNAGVINSIISGTNLEYEQYRDYVNKLQQGILNDNQILATLSQYAEKEKDVKDYNEIRKIILKFFEEEGTDLSFAEGFLKKSGILDAAVADVKKRQLTKDFSEELLANTFDIREEIVSEIFKLDSSGVKNLALEGTKKVYSDFYDKFSKDIQLTDEVRHEYAKSLGGTYNEKTQKFLIDGEVKEYSKEQVLTWKWEKESLEATEEAAKATEDWLILQSKQVRDFVSGLGKRTDLLPDSAVQEVLQGLDEVNGLFTSKEVNQNWQQKYNEIDEKINEATGDILTPILGQIDEVSTNLSYARRTGASKEIIDQLEKKRQELIDSIFGGLSISSYGQIGQLITTAGTNYGTTKAANLFTVLSEGISKYSGTDEQRNKFASALYEVDWKTIDSIDEFSLALEELGISIDVTNDFKELADALLETQKAIKTFNLKELQKNAKEILDLRDNLKSATNATFDEDTYKKLLQYGVDRSKFTYTGQGYTYTGGLVKDLDKVLQNYLQEEAKNTKDVLSQQIEEGKKLEAAKQGLTETSENLQDFFGGKLEKKDSGIIRDIFSQLGFEQLYNKETGEKIDLSEVTEEGLLQFYSDYLDYLQNYKAKQVTVDEIDKNLPFYGHSNDYVRQYGGDTWQQIAAAKVNAESAGINIQELDAYAQKLHEVSVENEALAYAIAYDNMLMNQGLQQLIGSYETWEKVLKAAEQDEAKKDTQEYTDTIVGLRQVVQKMTGTTVQFSEKFLTATSTLDLFKKAVNGDTDAINQLRKSAARDILPDLTSLGEAGDYLNNWINDLKLDDIKIGTELDLDTANAFQALLDAGQMTAEQVNAALESIGYEPTIGFEEISVNQFDRAKSTGYIKSASGGMDLITSETDLSGVSSVMVPILGSSSKGNNKKIGGTKYKGGGGSTANPTNKKSGGGGGGKEFKNDFDKYYNQVEDINELERQRNLLEKDYDQLLKSESKSGKEIYDNLQRQLALLRERASLTADLAEKRKQQIIDTTQDEQYKDVAKYAWWNEADLTIEIDWDAINQIKDSEQGDLVKEYVKKLEDFQSKYDDMIENLEDIESTIQEINERGQEEYQSLEDRTRDALIKQIQDKIDELSDVNESINDTNQKLFDSINETLQLQRQERTNAETEDELTDKEKRLAYLQQDSSNANQLEIAKLQKEIDDARQDYTDNLIDQKISELQRQNDEAAEQRQRQIDLMQRSLDWQEKSGAFWQEVYRLISEGTDATGQLVHASELEQLLKYGEAWESLSDEGKMQWLEKLEDEIAQGIAYLEMQRQLETIGTKEGTNISFTNASGQTLSGIVDKNGNVVVKNADGSTTTYKDVFQDYHGAYRTFEGKGEVKAASKPATSTTTTTTTTTSTKASTGAKPGDESDISNNGDLEYFYEAEDDFDHWVYYRQKGTTKWENKGLEGHNFINGACSKCHYIKQSSISSKVNESNVEVTTSTNSSVNREPDIRELNQTGVKKPAITKYSYVNDSTCRKVTIYTDGTSSSNNGPHDISRTNGKVFCKNCGYVFGTPEANVKQASGGSVAGFESTREENSGFLLNGLIKRYASGGLNTRTGLAWLDGTRSNPELVLNARDTQNFIELKDTLASIKSGSDLNLTGGDNYYDIKVQVDSLGSDYDVDRAIDRIKARIAQDGAYRNVNTLSRLR